VSDEGGFARSRRRFARAREVMPHLGLLRFVNPRCPVDEHVGQFVPARQPVPVWPAVLCLGQLELHIAAGEPPSAFGGMNPMLELQRAPLLGILCMELDEAIVIPCDVCLLNIWYLDVD
jgi:hypothetical protein